ncbi:glutathionylspermidine synthase family protein [Paenibacillus koleovorans]|uniref:glutathionylspermidine synthase family protein n=1 Tax=Paenibacillus koleovorans TaxID=121608 RepID=UPI001FE3553F|nr:glutathionylspermidine synthase family protein [Paenibacillus koleovorans]
MGMKRRRMGGEYKALSVAALRRGVGVGGPGGLGGSGAGSGSGSAGGYADWRERLYGPLREEGLFPWDRMYGEEYAVASVVSVSAALRTEIAEATERLGRVFNRTLHMARLGEPALFEALGLPEATWRAVRVYVSESLPTVIGRFDFAETPRGLKMLELNSDTPTSVVEAYAVNGRVCELVGMGNPNAGMTSHLREAFTGAAVAYAAAGFAVDRVAFSALDWHEEDAGTTRYLLAQSGLEGRFVPLSDLRVYEDRLCEWKDGRHEPIDLLYRLHAMEKLAEDEDEEDGYPTGAHVLDLLARGRLCSINPPSALLAQTKAFQALIWNLHAAGDGGFFTQEEHEAIEAYMLPTYLEESSLAGVRPYVTKPVLGREGGAVTLYGADGAVQERDGEVNYWEQPMVVQEQVDLPVVELETERGVERGRMLWGSFLTGGKASAIVARAGGRITGNLSYYVPIGLE